MDHSLSNGDEDRASEVVSDSYSLPVKGPVTVLGGAAIAGV